MQGLPESGKANFVLKNLSDPPPPGNENLGRSWHFEFELVWRVPPTPSQIRKWKFGQIFALWVWVGLESTPSPFLEYVETNRCIPKGYHLVCFFKHGSSLVAMHGKYISGIREVRQIGKRNVSKVNWPTYFQNIATDAQLKSRPSLLDLSN